MLNSNFTPRFTKDIRKLKKKHVDVTPLKEVMNLIIEDTPRSRTKLKTHHNMHPLKGVWHGSFECHIANAGDWLIIWARCEQRVIFQRTGKHDELFARGS